MSNTTYFPGHEQMQTAYFSNPALSWCSNEKMISRRKSQVYWVLVPVLCVCVCVCVCINHVSCQLLQEYVTSPSFDILEHTASRQVIGRTYHRNRHVISNDNQNSSEIFTQRSLTTHDSEVISYFR